MNMAKKHPKFQYEACIACGMCVTVCPVSALSLSETNLDKFKKAYPALNDRECIGCGQCEKSCPMGAANMVEDL